MFLRSYWLGNFVVDFMKMEICSLVLCLFFKKAFLTFLLFPLSAIVASYSVSFAFHSVKSAQWFVFLTGAFFILILPGTMFCLDYEAANLILKILPGYSLGSTFFFQKSHWLSELLSCMGNLFFWSALLFTIESKSQKK